MLKKIGIGLALVIVAFLAVVAAQPADYTISREIAINAPAEKVFPYLNNSRLGDKWGPWKEVDPKTAMIFSGPEEGVGARTSWEKGEKLGTGSATIVSSEPNQRVGIRLEYTEPMSMVQDAEYSIRPADGKSVVTWKVQGKNTFMGRVFCAFGNMDKMIGGMFEKGLNNLKQLVESN